MNKILYIALLFFSSFFVSAQTEANPPVAVIDSVIVAQEIIFHQRELKKDFKTKYTAQEFIYSSKTKAKTDWDRFLESVGDFLDDIFSVGDGTAKASSIIFRIIMILIVGFVIYLIVRAVLNKEGMWIFGRSHKKISMQDITTEDIHQMDFRKMIEDTKNDQNHKLAIRYYYLWLLKKLSTREIIDWHQDKTNSDYLYEIKSPELKKDFEYLSYVYDYSWYGDFPLDAIAFGKAEKAFQKTLNTL